MNLKKIFAGAAAAAVAVSAMIVPVSAETYEGSLTMSDTTFWSEHDIALEDLVGDLDPEEVKSIIFFAEGHEFVVGYSTAEGWEQPTVYIDEPIILNDVLFTTVPDDSAPEGERGYYMKACLSAGNGEDYTLSWIASTELLDLSDFVEEDEFVEPEYAFESSVTITSTEADEWWTAYEPTLQELIGDLDPAIVTAIVFTCDEGRFHVGYNATEAIYNTHENPYFCQNENQLKRIIADNASLVIDEEAENGYYFTLVISEEAGTSRTIKWGVVVDESLASDVTPAEPESQPAASGAEETKDNPDTGVEGVVVVAGIAVIAAGAVVVAKKRN